MDAPSSVVVGIVESVGSGEGGRDGLEEGGHDGNGWAFGSGMLKLILEIMSESSSNGMRCASRAASCWRLL